MKIKTIRILLSVSMAAAVLTACAGSSTGSGSNTDNSASSGTVSTQSAQTDYSAIAAQTVEKANTTGTKGNNYDSKVQEYADANTLDNILKAHNNVQIDTQILYEDGNETDFSRYYDKNGCIYTGSDGKSMVKIGDTIFGRDSDTDKYKVVLDLWPDGSGHSSDAAYLGYGFPQDADMIFSDPETSNGQVEIQVTNQKTGLQGSLNFDESSKELQNYFYMVIDPKTQEMTVTSYNDNYQYGVDTQEIPSGLTKAQASKDTYTVTVIFDPSDKSPVTRTYTVPKGYTFSASEGTSTDGTYKYELYTDKACTQKYEENSAAADTDVTLYAAKTTLK